MKKLLFLDTETTGLGDIDRLCQIAYKLQNSEMVTSMYKPPVEIGVEAMAVHKITDKMVRDLPPFENSPEHKYLVNTLKSKNTVLVAHNAPFDIKMIEREKDIKVHTFIDTIKVARYLLKDDSKFKKFSLQNLRYQIGIELPDSKAHDASGDVEVLEAVFNWLFELARKKADEKAEAAGKPKATKEQIINRMIDISMNPENPAMVKFTMGKYKDQLLSEVAKTDIGYFKWIVENTDLTKSDRHNPDFALAVKYYLKKYANK